MEQGSEVEAYVLSEGSWRNCWSGSWPPPEKHVFVRMAEGVWQQQGRVWQGALAAEVMLAGSLQLSLEPTPTPPRHLCLQEPAAASPLLCDMLAVMIPWLNVGVCHALSPVWSETPSKWLTWLSEPWIRRAGLGQNPDNVQGIDTRWSLPCQQPLVAGLIFQVGQLLHMPACTSQPRQPLRGLLSSAAHAVMSFRSVHTRHSF